MIQQKYILDITDLPQPLKSKAYAFGQEGISGNESYIQFTPDEMVELDWIQEYGDNTGFQICQYCLEQGVPSGSGILSLYW